MDNIEILDINDQPHNEPHNEIDSQTVNFSVVKAYGEDLTAKKYITNPAIGREKELRELILILLTPDKSAVLIGKPGVGKTACVEGLAYLIINDKVPDGLKGYEVIKVN